ncbi:hypothetical protein SDC9_84918 [bioreactor metagenome]|uniref:Uncharacterized protein n=1 Tax=bioreactor metagenome TaxID=1076179 RepID=A0A644ZC28_9ZZZZ
MLNNVKGIGKDTWISRLKLAAFVVVVFSIGYLVTQEICHKISNVTAVGIASGYFASYIVYILTIWLPDKIKTKEAIGIVSKKLRSIHNKLTLSLLLAYKNACTDEEWAQAMTKTSDEECFDDQFFMVMRKFDIMADADSLFRRKDDLKPIKWYENFDLIFNVFDEYLKEIILKYNQVLPSSYTEIIYNIQESALFELFTGNHQESVFIAQGKDGYKYFDDFPARHLYKSGSYETPIFSEADHIDNSDILKKFVALLKDLKTVLAKQCGDAFIAADYGIAKLRDSKAGHVGTAIVK